MATLLIIEDNALNAEMAGELLKKAGHDVITTEDAVEGIKLAKLKSPDLVLMDLGLPQMDGLTATRILKDDPLTRNIPVVAFTALVMKSDEQKAYGAGCSGFIPKPIDTGSFASTVEKFIASEANEQEIIKSADENNEFTEAVIVHASEETKNTNLVNKWHKILIVDDNEMNADLLREILEQVGQSSIIAYSGTEALQVLETDKVDLILLDIMMPGMSGFEAIKHLQNNPLTADIPVIFISALSETENIVKGLDLGSYGYITKPFNIDKLKAKVLSVLRIKDLQDQIKSEKSKLDLIFKFSADGIVLLNSAFEIISCNSRFAGWFGYSEEELDGKDLCSLIYTKQRKDIDGCTDFVEAFSNYPDNRATKEILIESNGEIKLLEVSYSKINPDEASAEGYVLLFRDITAWKEIEKQKETFVATLTHDLKTPIRAEIRALELLLNGNFGEMKTDQAKLVEDILGSSKYMFNMVDNLLAVYRYENGSVTLQKDVFDINSLISECVNELKYIISDKNQELSLNFGDTSSFINADALEIRRVIINLLSNALNYTQENGKIDIKTETNNGKISVTFEDNGRGLSSEEIKTIFERYASNAKKFRQVGTGLGLYLCKQVVEAHGGEINVESAEGAGSSFTFSLPVV